MEVCGCGLARTAASIKNDQALEAEYVAHRWYRAPDVLLTLTKFTEVIDLWSVGCILSEMLGGKSPFPGKNVWNQFILAFNILGIPTVEDYNNVESRGARAYIRSLPFKE